MLEFKYAEVNGVRLHYATAGTGKLILFLHGFPEFWYAWKNQLIEFARDRQAVAPDLRGYNLSSRPAEVELYQVTELVEDVRALAAHLGHSKFILVGHDWGGAVAWATALYHPESLEKLIIINAPHPGILERELRSNPAQQQASQYMLMFRSRKLSKSSRQIIMPFSSKRSWPRAFARAISPKKIAQRTSMHGRSPARSPAA